MLNRMRRVGILLAIAATAGIAASSAWADTAYVNPTNCALFHGGQVTVPAGSTITVRQGFSEQTRGILQAFLNSQTSTVSVNGGSPVDVSDQYSTPVETAAGDFATRVVYPTGITLGAGESLTIAFTLSLRNVVPEVFNPAGGGEPGKPAFNVPGSTTFTCTVTAT